MSQASRPLVELLSKPDCHLCTEAKHLLRELQGIYSFTLREINILNDQELSAQYGEDIPVVLINGRKAFKHRIDIRQFVRRLQRLQGGTPQAWWQRFWHQENG